jgi:hypothetical protein
MQQGADAPVLLGPRQLDHQLLGPRQVAADVAAVGVIGKRVVVQAQVAECVAPFICAAAGTTRSSMACP